MKHFVRIKTTDEFNLVYSKASKVWHNPCFVLFYKESNGYNVGFVAGKKVGKAVQRNRAKRLMRALFISKADSLKEGNYVFVAKHAIINEPYSHLTQLFETALKRTSLYKIN